MMPPTETTYRDFLAQKQLVSHPSGFDVAIDTLPSMLFGFQRDIVRWALRRGRAAIFADCGLGKTPMQLEWARHVCIREGSVLILAPLAVAQQTRREGEKFGIDVAVCQTQSDVRPGINVANYERLHHFDPSSFAGVVLDESSILKAYDGKTRTQILDAFRATPYKLACTATPAPNDHMELGNHAEFLGVMNRTEMLSMFFVHDGGDTSVWRLKGHAEDRFWEWVASWAVMMRKPSDLGYSDTDFSLPPLYPEHHVIPSTEAPEGYLFPVEAITLDERRKARSSSLAPRVARCAELVNADTEPWIVWCDLNAEGDALERAIPGSVQIQGSDTPAFKEESMVDFAKGAIRVLITKPSIAGFGMNWQHCANVAFVGLSDSYEQFYQAVRRCWRFGQQRPVHVHLITSEAEGAVLLNIQRKERDAQRMAEEMVKHMHTINETNIKGLEREKAPYAIAEERSQVWTGYMGDCVEWTEKIATESIDYSIFSPPFASLYTYSNSERDMGNCKDDRAFARHFRYLVGQLYRVLKPGRLLSFHCMLLPTSKQHHGYIGLLDFRGMLIRMFQRAGFIFHSEVVIWKDPVTAMQRTKALGLLYKQLKKDSAMSRQGVPDYLITMRKPGTNPDPVTKDPNNFPVDLWQRYASPVWMDINPSDTLQGRSAREEADERHICPLQLEVIERAVKLWTNPGDVVLSPFMGIGSEGYVSIRSGRQFVGIELKESYYRQACANLRRAEVEKEQPTLFDLLGEAA